MTLFKVHKTRTTAFRPQSDGLAERLNRSLQECMKALLTESCDHNLSDWDERLPEALFAYNTRVQSSTGFTPFRLQYGREARLPTDLTGTVPASDEHEPFKFAAEARKRIRAEQEIARRHLGQASKRQKELYDRKVYGKPYSAGDRVMFYYDAIRPGCSRKFWIFWRGPYVVKKRLSETTYRIQLENGDQRTRRVAHFNKLAPYRGQMQLVGQREQENSANSDDEDDGIPVYRSEERPPGAPPRRTQPERVRQPPRVYVPETGQWERRAPLTAIVTRHRIQ